MEFKQNDECRQERSASRFWKVTQSMDTIKFRRMMQSQPD
jgi:hypothetical protein